MSVSEVVGIGVIGLGKMGISHFALANAHPRSEVMICDREGFQLDVLKKYVPNRVYTDAVTMMDEARPAGIVVATPSRLHGEIVRSALERGIHVFCEKPFCLDWNESFELADLAEQRGLVNQVGYHYRHVGAFQEMKRIVESGALGTITHVLAEAYGPVILQPKRATWRGRKSEGGGCLYDYAAHPLNLLNWLFGVPVQARGSVLNSIFSAEIDDEVYSTLTFSNGVTAQLAANWSDESHRKMSTRITMIGTNGRLFADRQECQLYLRAARGELPGYEKGWNVRYTTELSRLPWFYLRGEEYSNQMDAFITAVATGTPGAPEYGFRVAAETDRTISMILDDHAGVASVSPKPAARKRGWFSR
ncbi:Gfo/Idh/MocA family protein [Sedimentitalea sp. XS_ASV28]|uniref:Gfo/Idh/MocA family protein n=1 Tax=Sedimentitalea sp. XS_ASV28 TaxID=3241296 RepID=UPI00351563DC